MVVTTEKGHVGEHLLMAELLYRGFDSYLGSRNNPSFDLACFWNETSRASRLRVKTTHNGNAVWSVKKKTGLIFNDVDECDDFVCVVDLKDGIRNPGFYIIPTKRVESDLKADHEFYVSFPKADGSPRKQEQGMCTIRFFGEDKPTNRGYAYDQKYCDFRDNWDQLK